MFFLTAATPFVSGYLQLHGNWERTRNSHFNQDRLMSHSACSCDRFHTYDIESQDWIQGLGILRRSVEPTLAAAKVAGDFQIESLPVSCSCLSITSTPVLARYMVLRYSRQSGPVTKAFGFLILLPRLIALSWSSTAACSGDRDTVTQTW